MTEDQFNSPCENADLIGNDKPQMTDNIDMLTVAVEECLSGHVTEIDPVIQNEPRCNTSSMKACVQAFRDDLPDLLKTHPGRWVLYFDGEFQGDFAFEWEAYKSASERSLCEGMFLVDKVSRNHPYITKCALR